LRRGLSQMFVTLSEFYPLFLGGEGSPKKYWRFFIPFPKGLQLLHIRLTFTWFCDSPNT